MKSLTSTAIVALTAAVIGLGAAVPAATAQQGPPPGGPGMMMPGQPGMMMPHQGRNHMKFRQGRNGRQGQPEDQMGDMQGPGRGQAMLDLVCSPRGAEALEIGLVRMSYRLQLTPEQQPLFDDLRTTALTAQTQFADACTAARPQADANAAPAMRDPVAGLKLRLDLEKAHTAALEAVLPKFEAFWTSLTDAQKAGLQPQRGNGRNRQGQGGMMMPPPGAPMQPGQPVQPAPAAPAPAAPTTTTNG